MPTLRRFFAGEIKVPAGSQLVGTAGGMAVLFCPEGPDILHELRAFSFPNGCDVLQLQLEHPYPAQFVSHGPIVMVLQQTESPIVETHIAPVFRWAEKQVQAWATYRSEPTPVNYAAWASLVPNWEDVPDGGNQLPFTWVPGLPGMRLNNCAVEAAAEPADCQVCGGVCPGTRRGAP